MFEWKHRSFFPKPYSWSHISFSQSISMLHSSFSERFQMVYFARKMCKIPSYSLRQLTFWHASNDSCVQLQRVKYINICFFLLFFAPHVLNSISVGVNYHDTIIKLQANTSRDKTGWVDELHEDRSGIVRGWLWSVCIIIIIIVAVDSVCFQLKMVRISSWTLHACK